MKYGIISDIHSNLEALETVIKALGQEQVDRYICLGDVLGYAADPLACLGVLKAISPIIVSGNHDWGCIGKLGMDYFNKPAEEAITWTKDNLSSEYKDWLEAMPLVEKIGPLTLVHGSLYRPEKFYYVLDHISARTSLNSLEDGQHVCLVGHTHIPGIFIEENELLRYSYADSVTIEPQKRYLINVGSVGQPRDRDPRASFVVYDTETRALKINRIKYDIRKTQEKILEAGLPRILARRLPLGR